MITWHEGNIIKDLKVDTQKIYESLEMDDEILVEGSACEMIYLRDKLIAVIKFEHGIPPDEILDYNQEFNMVRLRGISCWIPFMEAD